MYLHILGTSAAFQGNDNPCAGYLLEEGGTRLLLDCGPGVLTNLPKFGDVLDLTAVIITHFHIDHYLDLYPLRYARQYSIRRPEVLPPLPVYAPAGAAAVLARVYPDPADQAKLNQIFAIREVFPGETYREGGLTFKFFPAVHRLPAYGLRIRGGQTLVYTGDTGESAELVRFAAGADLLLCEATLQERDREKATAGHLTAAQAGSLGRAAGVRQLLLTHIWPEYDRAVTLREARETFGPGVSLAETNQSYLIGPI